MQPSSRRTRSSPSRAASKSSASRRSGKAPRDVVAGAGEEAAAVGVGGGLDADAVPFPLGGEVGGVELLEVALVEGVREHDRAERGGGLGLGARRVAGEPGEERDEGRCQAVPELLDLGDVLPPELGQRLLGEAGGDADAQAAGDELEEREAAGGVEPVEQALDHLRGLAAGGGAQGVDDLRERRVVGGGPGGGPDQGDGLGEVADEVVGVGEELGVDALDREGAEHGGLHRVERQVAGDRRQRPATVGVGGGAQVVGEELQLAVAGGREGEAFQELGEAAHGRNIVRAVAGAYRLLWRPIGVSTTGGRRG